MPTKAENMSVCELRRICSVRMCTGGVSVPSLHCESTDSLIVSVQCTCYVYISIVPM